MYYETLEKKAVLNPVYPEYSRNTFDNISAALKKNADTEEYDHFSDRKLIANIDALKHLTDSSDVHVHHIDENDKRIMSDLREIYVSSDEDITAKPPEKEKEHIAEAIARLKEPITIDSLTSLHNIFPQGVQLSNDFATNLAIIPIMGTNKKERCYLVIELIRENNKPYTLAEMKLITSATKWIALRMEQNEVRINEERNFNLNVKLRGFIEQYFLEAISYDDCLSNILSFAKNLVQASRVFFYKISIRLNAYKNQADLYEDTMTPNGPKMVKRPDKFKINRDKGLASQAIETGETIIYTSTAKEHQNIRLDAEVLKLLNVPMECSVVKPLMYNGIAIAVMQFVNKNSHELFAHEDLVILERVCVYLSLVQHFEKIRELYEFEYAKCEIIRDQLGYHLTTLATVPVYLKLSEHDLPEGFHEYGWYPEGKEDLAIPYCFYLFKSVCPDVANEDDLYEFLINVRKCNRPLPYRNFMHTLDAMHTMYCLINDIRQLLNRLETYALMLAAACQSVNSEGHDSQYYMVTNNPYTYVYDHPHFRNFQSSFSKRVIEHHKLLVNFTDEEQVQIFKIFNDCLVNLNTGYGGASIAKLTRLVNANKIIEGNPQHRFHQLNLIMRAVCKARVAKPFRIAKRLCEDIYRELFAQGDLYKAADKSLQPWMDRANVHMIPEFEVQYIKKVCLPIYELLKTVYPETAPLYNFCKELKKAWVLMIELRFKKAWNPDESIGKSLEETTK